MKKNETTNSFFEMLNFEPTDENRQFDETSAFAEILEVEQVLF